jgi:hypothetical protein
MHLSITSISNSLRACISALLANFSNKLHALCAHTCVLNPIRHVRIYRLSAHSRCCLRVILIQICGNGMAKESVVVCASLRNYVASIYTKHLYDDKRKIGLVLMHVRVCVCVCACVCVCVCVCARACVCSVFGTCMVTFTFGASSEKTHAWLHTCSCVCACMYVCMCMHVHFAKQTQVCMHTHICACACMYANFQS